MDVSEQHLAVGRAVEAFFGHDVVHLAAFYMDGSFGHYSLAAKHALVLAIQLFGFGGRNQVAIALAEEMLFG